MLTTSHRAEDRLRRQDVGPPETPDRTVAFPGSDRRTPGIDPSDPWLDPRDLRGETLTSMTVSARHFIASPPSAIVCQLVNDVLTMASDVLFYAWQPKPP